MKYMSLCRSVLVAACLPLTACAAGDADLPPWADPDPGVPSGPTSGAPDPDAPNGQPPLVPPSARERLGTGVGLAATPARGYLDLHATAEGMAGTTRATLPVQAGRLGLRARGESASLEALVIVVGDVTVPLPGLDPLVLRDVRLELGAPLEVPARFPTDDTLWISNAPAPLVLAWSLVTPSGRTVALGPQRLEGIALSLELRSLRDGRLEARLGGRATGLVWQWASVLSLSDVVFDVSFEEAPAIDPARPPHLAPVVR